MANGTWTQYYEVINSGTAAIAPGAAVSFSTMGDQYVGNNPAATPTQVNDTTFQLSAGFTWRVSYQIPVANSGQLALVYAGNPPNDTPVDLTSTVVGTSWGHSQIVGDFLLTISASTYSYWNVTLVNPTANNSSINLLSHGSGNIDVVVSIIFECLA